MTASPSDPGPLPEARHPADLGDPADPASPADRGVAGVRRVADVQLRGRSGPLPARAYWPVPPPDGPPALLVLLPAGGGRDGLGRAEARARGLCVHAGAVVLSVGYRPPPGGPTAVEDAVRATWWAEDHATELGADPGRLVLAGEGAAADLVVAVAQRARDEGWPPLARQVLMCAESGPSRDGGAEPAGDPASLAGLPATTVIAVGAGRGPAAQLRAAGVEVNELTYGRFRAEDVLAPGGPVADQVTEDLGLSLRSVDREGRAWR